MRIFIAGGSGAIGFPLVSRLVELGHDVTGMTRTIEGVAKLSMAGATAIQVDAFDTDRVLQAVKSAAPDVVIDQLTSLPKDPSQIAASIPFDRKLRVEGGANLLHAAKEANVRRYLQQSSGFFLKASGGLANEDCPFAVDASPNVAISARTYDELERRLVASPEIEAVVLRYGFFYGPGTWYHPEGAAAEIVRQQQRPIIGAGNGVWSWVHLDDAVDATVSALTCPPGKYNVVDDDPVEVRVWLPAFARFVNAPPPATITEGVALELAGEDAVYYATRLSGASNRKAKEVLNFVPRRLEWLGKL